MRHHTTSRILWGTLFVLACGFTACGPRQEVLRDDDQVVGRPPSPSEDPFLSGELPLDAQRVDSSGSIDMRPMTPNASNPVQSGRKPSSPTTVPEAKSPGAPSDRIISPDSFPEPGSPTASSVQASQPSAEDRSIPQGSSSHRCYSCVRVCAQSDASGDCSDSKEDMVCGWGHSIQRSDAQTLAQAQCDATLDLMRQTPQWSTIDGRCPPASCR